VESNLLNGLRQHANALATTATRAAVVEFGIVLAALVAALALMLMIARLMLRPLRVLRTTALDVAYTRLPQTVQAILDDPDPIRASKNAVEPVAVASRDEIGEVARSFDVVHEQAVKMAAEQALLRENVKLEPWGGKGFLLKWKILRTPWPISCASIRLGPPRSCCCWLSVNRLRSFRC